MASRPRGIVVGVTSDIGLAIARDWFEKGISTVGTYRTLTPAIEGMAGSFEALHSCDFADINSIDRLITSISKFDQVWDFLTICPGTMEPIGTFSEADFQAWSDGFLVNFLSTMRVLHGLLPLRSKKSPFVCLFAGGGTNSAPIAFSSYTISKIALIKAVELLHAEMPDLRITIIGPGWVKTKIHEETLRSEDRAPESLAETKRRMQTDEFNPISRVVDCVGWAMTAPADVVGGRNFSVVHDPWGSEKLSRNLRVNPDMYKLRRVNSSQK